MVISESISRAQLDSMLRSAGFAFLNAESARRLLRAADFADEWKTFAASWNDLAPDTYLLTHGRYRRRRHAVFCIANDGAIERQPHQPHYQSREYNTLQGDIERWFEPIAPTIADGPILRRVLAFCLAVFGALAPDVRRWRCEVHQFRIEASKDQEGQPTPEGVHRDGVDYVLVLLIDRQNIVSGTTTIHSANGDQLGSFTLTDPLDAAVVDDERVFHGVTPVRAVDEACPAFRDVLVVTLRKTHIHSYANPNEELRAC